MTQSAMPIVLASESKSGQKAQFQLQQYNIPESQKCHYIGTIFLEHLGHLAHNLLIVVSVKAVVVQSGMFKEIIGKVNVQVTSDGKNDQTCQPDERAEPSEYLSNKQQ